MHGRRRRIPLTALTLGATALVCPPAAAGSDRTAVAAAYGERPMVLPARANAASSSQPATWLIGARPGVAAKRLARRLGAQPLRQPGGFRIPRARARPLAGRLRASGLLRYAEPDVAFRRRSALDADPGGGPRAVVARPGLTPPPFGRSTIALVDDVIDLSHPDVAGNTRALNPGPGVVSPHGTQVASVAAGALNGSGVFGVFPGAPVLSVGLGVELPCSQVSEGVIAAARADATVINLSLGSPQDCFTLFRAVQAAYAAGSLVVAAAGNEFQAGNPVIYPAAYPHVLSVAAIDPRFQATAFSSENAAIDVAAPGVGIPVATPAAFDADGAPDGVTIEAGTSFAAPIVSGAAAWLAAARPDLASGQLADILRRTSRDLPPAGYDNGTGYGLVDLGAALAAPTPRLDPLEPNDGITFVNGVAFGRPDPFVWRGSGRRRVSASVDLVEDPVDVYRIRVPRRSRFRVVLRPNSGDPDLAVYDRRARTLAETGRILARSRRSEGRTDVARLRNRRSSARIFYVAIDVAPDTRGGVTSSYRLEFVRQRR